MGLAGYGGHLLTHWGGGTLCRLEVLDYGRITMTSMMVEYNLSKIMNWKMVVLVCLFPDMIFLFWIMIEQQYHNQEFI